MTKLFENAMKAIEPNETKGNGIPTAYDMSLEDTTELTRMAMEEDPFLAVHYAFMFGFVMGNRATHSRKLRRL